MIWTGAWHPLAERFPMLGEDELREMAASIAEHGQFVPCRMSPDGLGLDGRNRVAACALAELKPRWEVYKGDPIAFIVEVNSERRHLTTGQRAMAVAIGLVEAGARRNGKFVRGSVPDASRSRSSDSAWTQAVSRAGVVLDYANELADAVLVGMTALDAAYREADERRKSRERIEALGGDLAALVDNGVIDVGEAERRVDHEMRIANLAPDLAGRVNDDTLTIAEAELIAAERREHVAAWAEKVRVALRTLGGMAGFPVPEDLAELLTPAERDVLALALAAIPEGGLND